MTSVVESAEQTDSSEGQEKPERRSMIDGLLSRLGGEHQDASQDWRVDSHRAYIEQQPLRARGLLYGVALVAVVLIVWSTIAEVDQVARGVGKVIPSRQVQVIQSQDGGVVTEIHVREGDVVQQGQLLVKLDQTRSQSSFRENRAEHQALSVKAARLRAIVENEAFDPPAELRSAVPRIVAQEQALYESGQEEIQLERQIAQQQLIQRQEELKESFARQKQLARSLELTQQELALTRPMEKSGAVSPVELLRLEREVNKLGGEKAQVDAKVARLQSATSESERKLSSVDVEYIGDIREELTETITRMNALREAGTGLSDRVKQTALRSPVNGTIKRLHFYTIGGVVLPGREIIEIVPLDDSLLVEVQIKPKDIAFLVPGQEAQVKLTAYDFAVYGGLRGVVEHIGADTVMDAQGKAFYTVRVRTTESYEGEDMPILPGMTVEVDILTGKKSIFAYFMSPIIKTQQTALTER